MRKNIEMPRTKPNRTEQIENKFYFVIFVRSCNMDLYHDYELPMRMNLCTFIAILAKHIHAHTFTHTLTEIKIQSSQWNISEGFFVSTFCFNLFHFRCENFLAPRIEMREFILKIHDANECHVIRWYSRVVITIVLHSSNIVQWYDHRIVMFQLFWYVIYGDAFEMNSSIIIRLQTWTFVDDYVFGMDFCSSKRTNFFVSNVMLMRTQALIEWYSGHLWLAINSSSSIDVCKFSLKIQFKSILYCLSRSTYNTHCITVQMLNTWSTHANRIQIVSTHTHKKNWFRCS